MTWQGEVGLRVAAVERQVLQLRRLRLLPPRQVRPAPTHLVMTSAHRHGTLTLTERDGLTCRFWLCGGGAASWRTRWQASGTPEPAGCPQVRNSRLPDRQSTAAALFNTERGARLDADMMCSLAMCLLWLF